MKIHDLPLRDEEIAACVKDGRLSIVVRLAFARWTSIRDLEQVPYLVNRWFRRHDVADIKYDVVKYEPRKSQCGSEFIVLEINAKADLIRPMVKVRRDFYCLQEYEADLVRALDAVAAASPAAVVTCHEETSPCDDDLEMGAVLARRKMRLASTDQPTLQPTNACNEVTGPCGTTTVH